MISKRELPELNFEIRKGQQMFLSREAENQRGRAPQRERIRMGNTIAREQGGGISLRRNIVSIKIFRDELRLGRS